MANIEDYPGSETFGVDVKMARQVKRVSHKTMAEGTNIDWRYLVSIKDGGAIPSLPVAIQFIRACGLPMERYFNPEIMREESELRQRTSRKLKLCPEEYLPIIEGAIDNVILVKEPKKNETEGV